MHRLCSAVLCAAVLPVSLSAGLATAQEPGPKPDRHPVVPVKPEQVDRWKDLTRHSVDFFDRHAYHKESDSYLSEVRDDGSAESDVRHIVASSRML